MTASSVYVVKLFFGKERFKILMELWWWWWCIVDNNKNRTHTPRREEEWVRKVLQAFLKVIGFRDSVEKGENSTTASLQKHCYKTALA